MPPPSSFFCFIVFLAVHQLVDAETFNNVALGTKTTVATANEEHTLNLADGAVMVFETSVPNTDVTVRSSTVSHNLPFSFTNDNMPGYSVRAEAAARNGANTLLLVKTFQTAPFTAASGRTSYLLAWDSVTDTWSTEETSTGTGQITLTAIVPLVFSSGTQAFDGLDLKVASATPSAPAPRVCRSDTCEYGRYTLTQPNTPVDVVVYLQEEVQSSSVADIGTAVGNFRGAALFVKFPSGSTNNQLQIAYRMTLTAEESGLPDALVPTGPTQTMGFAKWVDGFWSRYQLSTAISRPNDVVTVTTTVTQTGRYALVSEVNWDPRNSAVQSGTLGVRKEYDASGEMFRAGFSPANSGANFAGEWILGGAWTTGGSEPRAITVTQNANGIVPNTGAASDTTWENAANGFAINLERALRASNGISEYPLLLIPTAGLPTTALQGADVIRIFTSQTTEVPSIRRPDGTLVVPLQSQNVAVGTTTYGMVTKKANSQNRRQSASDSNTVRVLGVVPYEITFAQASRLGLRTFTCSSGGVTSVTASKIANTPTTPAAPSGYLKIDNTFHTITSGCNDLSTTVRFLWGASPSEFSSITDRTKITWARKDTVNGAEQWVIIPSTTVEEGGAFITSTSAATTQFSDWGLFVEESGTSSGGTTGSTPSPPSPPSPPTPPSGATPATVDGAVALQPLYSLALLVVLGFAALL
eukprot:TRINITY_DN47854_c0_g1_i1.p1 TRINITY_DN47854_c0_g1~~TRINITY_DN47854_c0_g1_i1.p1  ORF type:complete len:698 (-),score=91.42 TRINITY_DN47854_c0_g1_i1:60-2153(-)